jgi:hypothetical protein
MFSASGRSIFIESRFHRAGQGCFYSGVIDNNTGKPDFSFIYDCGTRSKDTLPLEHDIHHFCYRLLITKAGVLDMLIISHFDADHVNRVQLLLKGVIKCKRVVLPYLIPAVRMQLFARAIAEDAKLADTVYRSFLENPVQYLAQYGNVGEINFISGLEAQNANRVDEDPSGRQPEGNDNPDGLAFTNDPLPLGNFPELAGKNPGTLVKVFPNATSLIFQNAWEFRFYNRQQEETDRTKALLRKFRIKFPSLDLDRPQKRQLGRLFAEKKWLSVTYKAIFGLTTLNPTSLIVWHGLSETSEFSDDYDVTGTLLLGDVNLEGINLPHYIASKIPETEVIQVPHHGSAAGWDINVLKAAGLPADGQWIINFGLGNPFGHPRQPVIDDLIATGWRIAHAHEKEGCCFYF